jgi:DnaJ-class molecular chaperone
MRDPYTVLGLERSASAQDIKRAFRKLAKESHPDRHPGDKGAQARFAELNSAHEILGDKEKRQKFDRGEIDAEGKPRFQGFEGFGGNAGGGGAGFENIDPRAFSDIFQSFSQQGSGGTRTFRFTSGHGPGGGQPPGGMGGGGYEADDILSSLFGGRRGAQRPPMPGADVKGEVAVTLEDVAAGRKPKVTLPNGRTVALTLPAGVVDGQTIRLQRQGDPSTTGGPHGDALVTVRFVPHPLFKPDGADLRLDLPISLDEAVLGAKIAVPTLSGKVQVTIPPHSSSGRVLRLKGKGLPKAAGHGDLLVTPRIVLPEGADAELDALMAKWREGKKGSVRGSGFE